MKRCLVVAFMLVCTCVHAGLTFKDGKIFDAKYAPEHHPKKHYEIGLESFENKNWSSAERHFRTLAAHFGETSYGKDAMFYAGVSLYHLGDMDLANEFLSQYLKELESASHYEEAFSYKFAIAEAFREGAKRHLFGMEKLPKWLTSKETAHEIYDEIIFSFPASELAAQSYASKGKLFFEEKDYVQAIETFQQLISKFPKHEKSAEAFNFIGKVYRAQLRRQTLDPDLLDLARINVKKFKNLFPGDPSIQEVQNQVALMEEEYAESLYETGQLYERKKHPKASVVYYYNVVQNFPNTKAANRATSRLSELEKYEKQLQSDIDA